MTTLKLSLLTFMLLVVVAQCKKLNVLFIIFDDMRPAIRQGYNDVWAHTPQLDEFIRQSHYFTRAYSQQALCAPSRNSMLTSRRPDTLQLYDFYNYWRHTVGNFTTLPQYFKAHNYLTHSVGKIFHAGVSSNFSDDYPLSWSQRPFHAPSEQYMNSHVCPDANSVLRRNLICPVRLQTQPMRTLPDIESATEAIRFLKQQQQQQEQESKNQPFFLALGFHKPHINLRFPKRYLKHFSLAPFYNYTQQKLKPKLMPNVAWNPYTDIRSRDDFRYRNISFPYGPISEFQSAHIRQAYYASIAYVDDLFGHVLKQVSRNDTIILVTSDHGWSLGEHAEWAKYSNFEVALRVPLIIHAPNVPVQQQRGVHGIVELLDVFPTLVDLAGLPKLSKCLGKSELTCTQGKSLVGLMSGGQTGTFTALSQYPRPSLQPSKNSDKPRLKHIRIMGYSLRTDCCRYTQWVRFYSQNCSHDWSNVYAEELYDHRFDASENVNVADKTEFHKEKQRLQRLLINTVDK